MRTLASRNFVIVIAAAFAIASLFVLSVVRSNMINSMSQQRVFSYPHVSAGAISASPRFVIVY